MRYLYGNKYGQLEIEVIDLYKNVSEFCSKDFPEYCFFALEQAEQIALITGNRGIQISFTFDKHNGFYKAYLVHHESPSRAALCRIVSLVFDSKINAAEELSYLAFPVFRV